jgi:hypothetical protein
VLQRERVEGGKGGYIVACYYGDWHGCQEQASVLNGMLLDPDIVVGNFAGIIINNQQPMSCSFPSSGKCEDDDPKLKLGNWQHPLLEVTPNMSVYQDTPLVDAWNKYYKCGHDDILIYDRYGLLVEYYPSLMKESDVTTETGYL